MKITFYTFSKNFHFDIIKDYNMELKLRMFVTHSNNQSNVNIALFEIKKKQITQRLIGILFFM